MAEHEAANAVPSTAIASQSGALTAPAPSSAPQNIIASVLQIATGVVQLGAQKKLASVNLTRAQQGLPPIALDQVPGITPTAAVNVGVESGTRNMLTFAAIGGGALLLLGMLRKKRR